MNNNTNKPTNICNHAFFFYLLMEPSVSLDQCFPNILLADTLKTNQLFGPNVSLVFITMSTYHCIASATTTKILLVYVLFGFLSPWPNNVPPTLVQTLGMKALYFITLRYPRQRKNLSCFHRSSSVSFLVPN